MRTALRALPILLGCVACAPQPAPWPSQFRLAASREADPVPTPTFPDTPLRIERVEGTFTAREPAVYYSLRYRSPVHIARYRRSQWAAPPVRMIGESVRGWLARSGRWPAVLAPGEPAPSGRVLALSLDVEELLQVFPAPEESEAVLSVRAKLRGRDQGELAQRRFTYRLAAPGADARGGAEALSQGLERLCQDLEEWVARETERRPTGGGG